MLPVLGGYAAVVTAFGGYVATQEVLIANHSGLGARFLASAGNPSGAEPLIELREFSRQPAEPSVAHAGAPNGEVAPDATTLLHQATRLIESLSGSLQAFLGAPKLSMPMVKLEVPVYRGYEDSISVTDFISCALSDSYGAQRQ